MSPWVTPVQRRPTGRRRWPWVVLAIIAGCSLVIGATIARLPTDARPELIESFAPQVGRLVASETFTKSSAVAVIERSSPISSEEKIVPPEGMREVPLDPAMTKAGSRSYVRYFVGIPDGPPCNAMIYAIDDPSTYERELDHPQLTDAIKDGRVFGYGLSIECAYS